MEPYHRRVRFQDVDAAGIIFFARYFEYAHEALEERLRSGGLPLTEILAARPWALPLVHAEADFARPSRFGDELVIGARLAETGASSLRFGFAIEGPDGPRARVETKHVVIDRSTFRPRPIPDELRDALARIFGAPGG